MANIKDDDPGNRKGYRYPSDDLREEDKSPFKPGTKFDLEWQADRKTAREKAAAKAKK
jgi:hypothetical protein